MKILYSVRSAGNVGVANGVVINNLSIYILLYSEKECHSYLAISIYEKKFVFDEKLDIFYLKVCKLLGKNYRFSLKKINIFY